MTYTVLYGEDVDVPFLDRLVAVDHACYEPAYWGDPANTVARYERNRRSFVFVVDDESGRLAGYVNFFPCELGLHQDNVSRSPVIRDDDIAPDEVAQYRTDENHLFVLSIAVHPAYQDGEVIRLLTDGFVGYLRRLRDDLPHQGRPGAENLPGLPDQGGGGHVHCNLALFPAGQAGVRH